MTEAEDQFRKTLRKQKLYVFLIRWWSVGAVYFFIGWGTQLGQYSDSFDLVFFLGMTIGIFNTLIINPVLKLLFNVGWHKAYGSSTALERLVCRFKDIGLALFVTVIVTFIYQGINLSAIQLLGLADDKVFLPGEPILFGLFYTLIFMLILILGNLGKSVFKRKPEEK